MIAGGIYDQIGGGFARYATDNEWLVPHFEKMLYDNALLVAVLCDAYRLSGNEAYRKVITDTIAFCKRELGFDATGGFWCALDADSERKEGKFYTWNWDEWQAVMSDAHPALRHYFGVTEAGNWEGTNILNRAVPEAELYATYGLDKTSWDQLLEEAAARLLAARGHRVRPGTDDKQLLSWNALMNTALVEASVALQEPGYLEDAQRHMAWMLQTFGQEDGSVLHVYAGGAARIPGKLEDYAYLVKALCRLAAVSGRYEGLSEAEKLMRYTDRYFLQEDQRFYYFSSALQQDIVVRKTELYDGATPSANAVMMENLWLLGSMMEEQTWWSRSESMLQAMKQTVMRYPGSFSRWAVFLQRYQRGLKQLVISGPETQPALQAWNRLYYPEIMALAAGPGLASLPVTKGKHEPGRQQFYLCTELSCRPPVATLDALIRML